MSRTLKTITVAFALLLTGCTLEEAKAPESPAPVASAPVAPMTEAAGETAPTPATSEPTTSGGSGPSVSSAERPASGEPTMQAGGPGGPGAGMPGGMPGMASLNAPLTKTPELDAAITTAEKSGDKAKIAEAYAKRGTFRMYDENAGARVKYRAALDDYRKALAADPKNAEATKNKKQIEDIYKSMGRPVPGE